MATEQEAVHCVPGFDSQENDGGGIAEDSGIRASHTSDAWTKRGWWWWLLRIRVLLARSGYRAIRSIKVSWAHCASIPIDSDYSGHEGGHQIPASPDKASVRHPGYQEPEHVLMIVSRVAEPSQARNARTAAQ